MARPKKNSLEYFPLDVRLDIKLKLLLAKFKLKGIGFIDMLWRVIYSEGYYIQLDSDKILLLSTEWGLNENEFYEMLNFCIDKGLFDRALYENKKILTSYGIQKRYFHSIKRIPSGEYLIQANENITNNKKQDNSDNDLTNSEIIDNSEIITKYFRMFYSYEPNSFELNTLKNLAESYGIEKIINSLKIAKENINKFNIAYIKGILENKNKNKTKNNIWEVE